MEIDGKEYLNGLLDVETEPLTEDNSHGFMKSIMAELALPNAEGDAKVHAMLGDQPPYMIFMSRLQAAGGEINVPAMLFILSLVTSPGDCVMWAYTINLIHALKKRAGAVNISDLTDFFPNGFPTEAGMQAAWDAQKDPGNSPDNKLDQAKYWPIAEKEEDDGSKAKDTEETVET